MRSGKISPVPKVMNLKNFNESMKLEYNNNNMQPTKLDSALSSEIMQLNHKFDDENQSELKKTHKRRLSNQQEHYLNSIISIQTKNTENS